MTASRSARAGAGEEWAVASSRTKTGASAPQGDVTQVMLSLTYTVPGSFLGAAFNKLVIEGQNEKDTEAELANLKRLSES